MSERTTPPATGAGAEHAAGGVPTGEPGYERSDFGVPILVGFGVGLAAMLVLAHVTVTGMLAAYEGAAVERDELVEHPMARFRGGPVGPILQPSPPADYDEHRAWEQTALETYGWIDPTDDVVRLPVERAMEILLERGLPVAGEAPGGAGEPAPAEPGSGEDGG